MATRLIQTLAFTDVAAGDTVALAHSINVNGVAKIPDVILQDAPGFTVTANSATVSVTNDGDATASLNVWLEYKHSMERAFGSDATTSVSPNPFVAAVGAPSGNSGFANTYDQTEFKWIDDWFLQAQLAQGNGWNGVAIGALPYSLTLSGANSAITQVTGHQRLGVVSLDCGTTIAGIAGINTQASLAFNAGNFDEISFDFVGGPETLADGVDDYALTIGLVGNAPGYGCYFVYDPADSLGGGASPNWQCWTMEAGVFTNVITAIPLAAVSFPNTGIDRLTVKYQSAAERGEATDAALFYINSVLVATVETTLPTHSLAGSVYINKVAGTNTRRLYMDYTCLGCKLTGARQPT